MSKSKLPKLIVKDIIKLNVIPPLASLLNTFFYSWEELGLRLGREVLIAQARKISSTIHADAPEKKLKIIFLTMMGGHALNTAIDAVLGWALKAKGHDVSVILCDDILPICEQRSVQYLGRWEELNARSLFYGKYFFEATGLKLLWGREIIDTVFSSKRTWEDEIHAGLLKHFKVGVIKPDARTEKVKALLSDAAKISENIGVQVTKMKPDRVIMSTGIYTTWGPARAILIENGVDVITYDKGKKKRSQKLNWNKGVDYWDVSREWEKVKEVPLTKVQNDRLNEYLSSRITHKADTLIYNKGGMQEKDDLLRALGLKKNLPIFTLFTNVLWDAASAEKELVFSDPIQWVFETINWFKSKPNLQLAVRIHPAEKVIGTLQPFYDLIMENVKSLPENIVCIKPETPVNSWSLIDASTVGLVHTSTVGMELVLKDIPCVVVSDAHYRGKGFTIDSVDRKMYFETLENYKTLSVTEMQKEYCRRYTYLIFERYQLPFALINEKAHTDARSFSFSTIDEMLEDKTINLIIDAIVNKKEFLLPE